MMLTGWDLAEYKQASFLRHKKRRKDASDVVG